MKTGYGRENGYGREKATSNHENRFRPIVSNILEGLLMLKKLSTKKQQLETLWQDHAVNSCDNQAVKPRSYFPCLYLGFPLFENFRHRLCLGSTGIFVVCVLIY